MVAIPKLTVSGNEITDVVRQAALEGDGRAYPDSSYGIWEATINLIGNGGFETNVTGWSADGAFAVSTEQAKFGGKSGKWVSGVGAYAAVHFLSFAAVDGDEITISIWVYRTESSVPLLLQLRDQDMNTIASVALSTAANVWVRATLAATMEAGDTSAKLYVIKNNDTTDITLYLDGAQAEEQPIATPYVETDGGTADRVVAQVEVPASFIDETQGWFAVRFRPSWPGGISGDYRIVSWRDNAAGDALEIYYTGAAGGHIRCDSVVGWATDIRLVTYNGIYPAGEGHTIIFSWTATTIAVSLDGSAFSSVARAQGVPTIAPTTFELGRLQGFVLQIFDGDYLWFACGTGTLSDANAAALHAVGDGAPPADVVPGAAALKIIWCATSAEYFVPPEREDGYNAPRSWMGG